MARLVAKAWVVICFYAGALALRQALPGSAEPWRDGADIVGAVLLFLVVGLILTGAAVALTEPGGLRRRTFWRCGFNQGTFVVFVVLCFVNQAFFAPLHLTGALADAVEQAAFFAVPGQRALVRALRVCTFDGGRIFASAFSWCLALIYFGSAVSRLKASARALRLRRAACPDRLGGIPAAVLLGVTAAAGIQLLYVGSGYACLPCSLLAGIAGGVVLGLAPLMLAYAIAEALTILIAGKT